MNHKKSKRRVEKSSIFIGILLLSLYACGNKSIASDAQTSEVLEAVENSEEILVTQSQFELAEMKLGELIEEEFPIVIHTTGRIEIPAKNHYKVGSYASGFVRSIDLSQGESVRKGQVLFTLENPEFIEMQQEFLETSEQQKYLESDYMRQKQLAAENVASQKNFLKAESAYRVNLSKLEGLKKRLSLLHINSEGINAQNLKSTITVYAPSHGYISSISATRGMYLNPTDIALELINTDETFVEMYVFEKDIMKVEKGQRINFQIADAMGDVFQAEVTMISKVIDPEKRAVLVRGKLQGLPADSKLVVGMYVAADIIIEGRNAKGVPETAIVSEDGKNYLIIKSEKRGNTMVFSKMRVEVGQKQGGQVEVLNWENFQNKGEILLDGGFNLIGIE